jgi:hypothetical protein
MPLTNDLNTIKYCSNKWAVDFNANKTFNDDFTRKNKHISETQFGQGGEIINRQNFHIHLQAYIFSLMVPGLNIFQVFVFFLSGVQKFKHT